MRESGGDAGAGMAGPRKQVPRWPSSMSVLWIRNTKPREVKSPVPYERDFGFIPYLLFTLACMLPLYRTSPWTTATGREELSRPVSCLHHRACLSPDLQGLVFMHSLNKPVVDTLCAKTLSRSWRHTRKQN